jgi:hypothetical protein
MAADRAEVHALNRVAGGREQASSSSLAGPSIMRVWIERHLMTLVLLGALLGPLLLVGGASVAHTNRATGSAVMDGVRLIYNNDGENLWAVDSSGARAGGATILVSPTYM